MKNGFNIIRTKLIVPEMRKNYVIKKNAFSKLNEITDYKVTIIKDTAGSGKTTLFSTYILEKKIPNVKWISLDKENNETFSFWYYFCESIKEFLSDDTVSDYFNEVFKQDSVYNLIVYIVNELSKTEKDIFITLDDFFYIKDSFLLSTIDYLIKYSSSNVHYILLTREELDLHLGELRAHGNVLELGRYDLKFTKEEASSFINNTLKINLPDDVIDNILKESEGWITGIQLIALTHKNKTNINISNKNTYIFQYLTEEILNNLKSEERDFLIKTSILNYFNAELCNELLNIDNSENIIESLINRNLFIILVDDENKIYRYHNMFKEFLNLRFLKLPLNVQSELHSKAYNIYKNSGNIEQGINQLLQLKDYKTAVSELNANLNNPKGWYYLKQIPIKYLEDYDELLIQRLYYHFSNIQFTKIKEILDTINIDNNSMINVFKVLIDEEYVDISSLTSINIDDLNYSHTTKCILYALMLYVLTFKNDYSKVLEYCHKAFYMMQKYKLTTLSIFVKFVEAIAFEDMGQLNKALDTYDETLNIINNNTLSSSFICLYHLGLAGVYLKMYKIKKAEDELDAISSSSYINENIFYKSILYHRIMIKFLNNDIDEGFKLCNILMERERESIAFITNLKISFNLYTKDDLKEYILYYEKEASNNMLYEISFKITYARAIYLYGDCYKGKELLSHIIEYCRGNHINTYLVDSLLYILIILSSHFEDNKREIFSYLREAIYYSCDNNYLYPFVMEYNNLINIINSMKNDENVTFTESEMNFINKLDDIKKINENKDKPLLTNREMEILKILCEGLSNKEIADKLHISLSTVKTHVINIYSKLNVSNRMQAIEKAKFFSL